MPSTSACALPAGSHPSAPGRSSEQCEWTCRLVPTAGRRRTLHLSGSLHLAWAGRLAAGLAARRISIVRAAARRGSKRWTSEIELDVLDGAVEPSPLDFIALMREPPAPTSAERLKLASYRATRTRRDVAVEIRGEDAVGLLGRILLIFADCGLFPRAMRVETAGSAVRDVFLLQDPEGQPPADALVIVLRGRLDELLAEE